MHLPTMVLAFKDNHQAAVTIPAGQIVDVIGPAEAIAIGLVDHVVDAAQAFEAAVQTYCRPILDKPRHVLAAFKQMIHARRGAVTREQLHALETNLFARAWIDEAHWRAADAALTRKSV